jgi:antitoxin (DNA-binding transcriptional repressor) of toxin-antitoxin stability system
MPTISTHEAKTHLSRYLALVAEAGVEVVICKGRRPVARLVPLEGAARPLRPRVGQMVGEPFAVSTEALRPLSDEELAGWGL